MVSENIQERIREPVKTGYVDISVPTILKSSKKTYDQLQVSKVLASVDPYCFVFLFKGRWWGRKEHNGFCVNGTQRQQTAV